MKSAIATSVLLVSAAFSSCCPTDAQQSAPIYDKTMRVVEFHELQYPAIGRSAEIQGIVVVRAKLNRQGGVLDVSALSGPEPLIPDCLANARKWRFTPGPDTAIVVYNFRLIDGIIKNGVSQFILEPPNFATITASLPRIQVDEKPHAPD